MNGAADAFMHREAVSQAVGCALTRMRERFDQPAALVNSMGRATCAHPYYSSKVPPTLQTGRSQLEGCHAGSEQDTAACNLNFACRCAALPVRRTQSVCECNSLIHPDSFLASHAQPDLRCSDSLWRAERC